MTLTLSLTQFQILIIPFFLTIRNMNIYLDLDTVDLNKITFKKPVMNKFASYNRFYKLVYDLGPLCLNAIHVKLPIQSLTFQEEEKKNCNRYKVTIDLDATLILSLKKKEDEILTMTNTVLHHNLVPSTHITDNKIIYYQETPPPTSSLFLYYRISGIWESNTHIGLTIKYSLQPDDI
jgi:hypothetical protein